MEQRTPLIAGNWKMFKTCPEAFESAKKLSELVTTSKDTDILIAPTFTALSEVNNAIEGTNISLGAQNVFWEKEGAFTGEISVDMIKSTGCEYIIIGHSERRQYFGETNETVNKKIDATIKGGLKPVMCIGETEKEYEEKKTLSVLDNQIKKGLEGFASDDLSDLVIAYEPVWAIGTGKTAKSDQAQDVHQNIRGLIEKLFGNVLANSLRILYGGSVKPENIKELMAQPDIDGVLVGGASLDPDTFSQIVLYK